MGKCAGEEFAAFAGMGILSSYLLLFISFYFATYRKEQKQGKKRERRNMAPGQSIVTNSDAGKLHQMHADNDKAALKQAWALLDATQKPLAKKILEDRGVEVPGEAKKPDKTDDSAGQPLPGMEP